MKKRGKILLFGGLWIASVFVTSVLICNYVISVATRDFSAFSRFLEVYHAIETQYFREAPAGKLWDGATAGMVDALGDPYSELLTGEKYENFMKQSTAEYGGIGIILGQDAEHEFYVKGILPGSVAEKTGILAGDRILSVDSVSANDVDIDAIAEHIRGEAGTDVAMTVLRNGEEISFQMKRSDIQLPTVTSEMLTEDIGYIHIYGFAQHTAEETKKNLSELKEKGAQKLVIDLRMNPGGMVDVVTDVAGQLLSKGTVVSYRSKDGELHSYDTEGVANPLPMVMLIDGSSASGSEILAGSAQDKKEALIIGENSFGKGTMQMVLQLPEKEALKLSIAEYITAGGRKIDKIGIKPDIEVAQTGMVFDKETDNVLARAIEELEK